jgi:Mrp family chromosome partitioning ATPase
MDGVLMVVHAGKTRRGAAKQAAELLQRARARVIGVVYNRLQRPKNAATMESYYFGDSYFAGSRSGDLFRRNGASRMIGAGSAVSQFEEEPGEL